MGDQPYNSNRTAHQTGLVARDPTTGEGTWKGIKRNLNATLGNADLGRRRQGAWCFYSPFE